MAKEMWEKFKGMVKTNPVIFGIGVAVGFVLRMLWVAISF